jgi:uncharacterized protein DUF3658
VNPVSHQRVEMLILSFARVQWRKVAMIIGQVLGACAHDGLEATDQDIGDLILGLVESGKLEVQGNLSMWRCSEVKLPD